MPLRPRSEFEPDHQLKLPGQSGSDIVGEERIIVVVVAVDGINRPKIPASRRRARKWSRLGAIEVEGQIRWISKLRVVEDIEYLDAKFEAESLRKRRLFCQRKIDLPHMRGANETVRFVAITSQDSAVRVDGWGRKSVGIN